MGKCAVCGKETQDTACVYIGNPIYHLDTEMTDYVYELQTDFFCADCVDNHANGGGLLKSAGFYLGLQFCWLSVFKSGILSPIGILAAAIAVLGLFRLIMLAGKWFYRRFLPRKQLPAFLSGKTDPQEEASDLYQATIEKGEKAHGRRVESLREYRRTHRV